MKQYLSRYQVQVEMMSFSSLTSLSDLADLLGISFPRLLLFCKNPLYATYYIKKKNGGKRLVEDPEESLKHIQRTLNDYLQSTYHLVRSSAAFGFVRRLANEKKPRNIITNARKHINKNWMMNLDFNDFFHHISAQKVEELFKKPPFGFNDELSHTLAALVSYKGRLPMGAPTSPVLSNFATLDLDNDLLGFSAEQSLTYTRFVDDLTFSSNCSIDASHFMNIQEICKHHGFELNADKTAFYGPAHSKYVTGLLVGKQVDVPDEYYSQLVGEIHKYEHAREINNRTNNFDMDSLLHHEQQLRGAIQFVERVVGQKHPKAIALYQMLAQANRPFSEFMPVSWLDFNYF